MNKQFEIGDRVEGGKGEDRDVGVIHEIKGDKALVGWESGVSTWTPIADLADPPAPADSPGYV